jgi:serine/threonine protein phosphatase 1
MSEVVRDLNVELQLQATLDAGNKVWVIGDIHGHRRVFSNLLNAIDPGPNDRIVILGDLIDRGPDSKGVIEICRYREDISVLQGNHEEIMLSGFQSPDSDIWSPAPSWTYIGGKSTMHSYRTDMMRLKDDLQWISTLPHMLILNEWILVHAGIEPDSPLEEQFKDDLLWIRGSFYRATEFKDKSRCVVFGHTITHHGLGCEIGEIGLSKVACDDGRPAWIGIDTGACDPLSGWLTAIELASGECIQAKGDFKTRYFEEAWACH